MATLKPKNSTLFHWETLGDWEYYTLDLYAPLSAFEFHAEVVEIWRSKCVGKEYPSWSDFELEDFENWWGWLTVIDWPNPDGDAARYRLWGTNVVRVTGAEYTGKYVNEIITAKLDGQNIVEQDVAFYRYLVSEKSIGYDCGPVNADQPTFDWMAIVTLPLSSDGRNIDGLLRPMYAAPTPHIAIPWPPRR